MHDWLIIIITLILSAFFSGMEIAFISANKLKTEVDKSKGVFSAKILSDFNKTPSRFIGAILLGNNIALVIYGAVMATVLNRILPIDYLSDTAIMIMQTIIATLLILFLAEFLPKALFRIKPNAILSFFAVPVYVFYLVFYPFIFLFIGFAEFVLNLFFKVKFTHSNYVFSPVDLDNYFKEFFPGKGNENDIDQEIHMFQNAIDFRSVKLRECMIPRTEIIALEVNDSIELLKQKFIETGLSKILIYKDSIDNIIGYTHSYNIFNNPKTIQSILKSIIIVPETMLANNVLTMFIKQHKSIALVVDEFGGTSGMLTMEDIIEEIFGEITDEHDVEDLIENKINETDFLFSGRIEIDYINEKYQLNLPESDDYETLAGLIIHYYESIPLINEKIIVEHFFFTIEQASETRIETVRLRISD